ncbi:MAG: alpha-hydroxy acid oxidase [Hyphomicrobiaceae bacterium]
MSIERCYNVGDFRQKAKKRLPAPLFHYIDGGADDEVTLKNNTAVFDSCHLIPDALANLGEQDLSTTVLGQRLDWPVFLSPTGMSRLFHHDGERAAARAAKSLGTMYSLSTMSTVSIEEIAAVSNGPKCFQIYIHKDRELTYEFVERAKTADFSALALTVDTLVAGNRERDRVTGMVMPPRLALSSFLSFATHWDWAFNYLRHEKFELANVSNRIRRGTDDLTSVIDYVNSQFDRTVTWTDVEKLISKWDGPFAIKGILSVDDARRAVDVGATAIMVSNHGGRQLDGAASPFEQLPAIVDAVGDRIEVILDGGVRRGNHVVKALALGARACMIGRGYLYALAAGGQPGVERALRLLRDEVERTVTLMGCTSLAKLSRRNIRYAGLPTSIVDGSGTAQSSIRAVA